MRDLSSNIGVLPCLSPSTLSATTKGDAVPLQGFGSLVMVITTGAITGGGEFVATLEHSPTALDTDFTPVAAGDMIGELPTTPLAAGSLLKVGYIGTQPFVRVAMIKGAGTSLTASVVAVLGHPALAPVA